jgi:acyl dehydratase
MARALCSINGWRADTAQTASLPGVDILGFSDIAFPKPVFQGGTIYAETEVLETHPLSSRRDNRVDAFGHRARNQDVTIGALARRTVPTKRLLAEAQ